MIQNPLRCRRGLMLSAIFLAAASCSFAQAGKPQVTTVGAADGQLLPPGQPFYLLESFGAVGDAAEATATLDMAIDQLQESGGGVLVIGNAVPAGWVATNTRQRMLRTPEPPAPAVTWGVSAGVTVIDTRGGEVKILVPQSEGIGLTRTVDSPLGAATRPGGAFPIVRLDNHVVRGSTSYLDFLVEPVEAGQDRRFYVPAVRGLFPGMFLNAHGGPGYENGVSRLFVKSLGWDAEKKKHYLVADTDIAHVTGAVLHNKSHINVSKINTYAHNELQSFDVMNIRHNYSQGDAHLFSASFRYMGNIHSAAGDENGVLYSAFIHGNSQIFRGTVEAVDNAKNEVIFADGAKNPWTLGTGRPLINLNPEKWITGGTVMIARPGSFSAIKDEDPSIVDPEFEGKTYPTTVVKSVTTGFSVLAMGGLILGSKDAPWTEDVIGRFFAVDEESEMVPGAPTVRRWYRIVAMTPRPDGSKVLRIQRQWWGAKEAGAPTLYRPENYTTDAAQKPLKYIIAPAAYVYDVSEGVISDATRLPFAGGVSPRRLKITPWKDTGTNWDFAPGDPIEQAIGPDPFHPQPFRAWMWDQVPSPWPSPVFDVGNWGRASLVRLNPRATVMSIGGTLNPHKDLPVFKRGVLVESEVGSLIRSRAAVLTGVVNIGRPDEKDVRATPVQWRFNNSSQAVNMTIDYASKALQFDGSPALAAPGGIGSRAGFSGTEVPAKNFRAMGVVVPEGSASLDVAFAFEETDADYAIFLQPSWEGRRALTNRTTKGFTVAFDTQAPAGSTLSWFLIR